MGDVLMIVREVLALIAFLSAAVFGTAGIAALFRFKEPYSRLQGSSLCGTTAVVSTCIGCLLLSSDVRMATRITLILVFFLVSAPTGSSIVARFMWQSGIDSKTAVIQTQKPARGDEET